MSHATSAEDLTLAWTYATNCSLYEEDPGPSELNIGSSLEPRLVTRAEAFRDLYAHLLLEDLGADHERITTLDELIDHSVGQNPAATPVWNIAANLCQRALAIIDGAGAAHDARARRRLLAGSRHLNRTTVLGQWVPAYQAEIDNDLLQELRATDD